MKNTDAVTLIMQRCSVAGSVPRCINILISNTCFHERSSQSGDHQSFLHLSTYLKNPSIPDARDLEYVN